jgi:SAM-dependent methyltransferase
VQHSVVNVRSRWMRHLWDDADAAFRARILAALPVDPSAELLDVGCEHGAWTEQVRGRLGIPPSHVHGLEVVEQEARLARARGFDVRVANIDDPWPFDDASIDIVHANQVIEHVERLDHFVSETRRVLTRRGRAIVGTENLASWHNVAPLLFGYQPFSATNISSRRPIGNPWALHAGEPVEEESLQHVHVITLEALRDIFLAHGFAVEAEWGSGYHPLGGRVAARLARIDPRHAHFVAVVARPAA